MVPDLPNLPEDVHLSIASHIAAPALAALYSVSIRMRQVARQVACMRLRKLLGAARYLAIPPNKRLHAMCFSELRAEREERENTCGIVPSDSYFPGFSLHVLHFPTSDSLGEVWCMQFTLPETICRNMIHGLSKIPVVEISAGRSHLLTLDAMGCVWSSGSGESGQLGHGHLGSCVCSQRIEGLDSVVQVSAGGDASLVLVAGGDMLSFGSGEAGQLGHGSLQNELRPRKIKAKKMASPPEKVRSICLGSFQAVAVGADGCAYWWGRHYTSSPDTGAFAGLNYIAGHVPWPIPVDIPEGKRITCVAVGSYHALLVGADGELFALGTGSTGQLGCAASSGIRPRCTLALTPRQAASLLYFNGDGGRNFQDYGMDLRAYAVRVPLPDGAKAAQPGCGIYHSAVLTTGGHVFTFGRGANGALGHGIDDDELVPRRVEFFSEGGATCIIAGGLFTIVQCKEGNAYGFGSFSPGFATSGMPMSLE